MTPFSLQIFPVNFRELAVSRWLTTLFIGLLAFSGSALVGLLRGIPEPAIHDEFSYLLAADTFAHGRITNPTHPMWLYFESFHIIQQPTYMSKYPPAQGLVLAVGEVIGGQPIWGVWLSFALMCAAITWMLYAWVSPRWALLGGLLAVLHPKLGIAGYWAQSYWGGAVAATGGALLMGALRRIVRQPRARDSFLMGVGLAILANSRPYEGLLVSIPVAIVLLTWLTSKKGPGIAISIKYVALPILIVCVLSGIAMGYYNFRVTGSPLRMPYQVYEAKYAMTPVFLWQRPRPAPIYHHQVFRDLDQNVSLEWYTMEHSIIGFTVKNLTYFFWAILYFWDVFGIPLIGMAPLMVRWAFRNRWALFALATCGVLTIGLVSQTYLAIHYLAPITCFNSVFVVQAIRLWRWRNRKVGQVVLWLLPLLALASLLWSLHWAIKKDNPSIWFRQRARILEQLQRQNEKHLIVVSYGPQHSFNDEWVYNEADIDNAKVVWARSMNTRENCQLVNFFKDRRIWSLEVNNDNSIIEPMPYPVNQCR